MVDITAHVNTNNIYGTPHIEEGAVHEFTNYGFAEGTYDATVSFSCMPAAIDDNALIVIVNVAKALKEIKEYAETVVFFYATFKGLATFLNKCHGFHKTIRVKGEDVEETEFEVSDNITEEDLQAKIFAILEIERIKTGKDVTNIMENQDKK